MGAFMVERASLVDMCMDDGASAAECVGIITERGKRMELVLHTTRTQMTGKDGIVFQGNELRDHPTNVLQHTSNISPGRLCV